MKNIKLILVCLLVSFFNAQQLSGIKICINPGHGGNDSNDRFIATTGFWESEGNLTKGLSLKDRLEALGATVIMTRVENKTSDDLPLSQIVAIANANNVDIFHSIHSNAHNSQVNYTLMLFQGFDSQPTFDGAKTMGSIMGSELLKANRTTSISNRGDFNFYGTGQAYLGVFKGLNMPGTLSEGSFHDYIPESWRLKNQDYLKHEALAMTRSFLKYYNKNEFTTGVIAGIVRDAVETVPFDYKPISTKNDQYKPLNNFKVTLNPGNIEYYGDNFNNGYFMFENLMPGEYTLIYEASEMARDSSKVTVIANQTVFADKFLNLQPILTPPTILSFSPNDNSIDVSNITKIIIEFDLRMNQEETQKAFKIEPSIDGSFSWENIGKKLIFTPKTSFIQGTSYSVKLSTEAKSFFNININEEKIIKFTTRNNFELIEQYPKQGFENISSTVMMKYKFNKPVIFSSLSGNVKLIDKNENTISVKVNYSQFANGIIEFEPVQALLNGENYKVILKGGISDNEYVKLNKDYEINFKVEEYTPNKGNIIEDFENIENWINPLESTITKGVKTNLTKYLVSTTKKYNGNNSALLEYEFTELNSDALINIELKNPIDINNSNNKYFGIWINGDNSKNIINYCFTDNLSNNILIFADSLNWTGWKLVYIDFNKQNINQELKFKSIQIVQTQKSDLNGKIYFDAVQTNSTTSLKESDNRKLSYHLTQNYPNPFNPSTNIDIFIPTDNYVSLKLYDITGREVATIIDEYKKAGTYSVKIDSKKYNLASGVYYYQLKSNNYSKTLKMILLK